MNDWDNARHAHLHTSSYMFACVRDHKGHTVRYNPWKHPRWLLKEDSYYAGNSSCSGTRLFAVYRSTNCTMKSPIHLSWANSGWPADAFETELAFPFASHQWRKTEIIGLVTNVHSSRTMARHIKVKRLEAYAYVFCCHLHLYSSKASSVFNTNYYHGFSLWKR